MSSSYFAILVSLVVPVAPVSPVFLVALVVLMFPCLPWFHGSLLCRQMPCLVVSHVIVFCARDVVEIGRRLAVAIAALLEVTPSMALFLPVYVNLARLECQGRRSAGAKSIEESRRVLAIG